MPLLVVAERRRGAVANLADVGSLRPPRALNNLKLYFLTFIKRLEALLINRGVVNEYVFATLTLDEPISLLIAKPLHSTAFHVLKDAS